MMKQEFEKLAKVEISYEDYVNVIEPMYTATDMSKEQFVEFILPSAKKMAKAYAEQKRAEREANQPKMFVGTGRKTPNGCYYIGDWGAIVSSVTEVRTGRQIIKMRKLTPMEQRELGWDSYLSDHVDIYTGLKAEINWIA